MISTVTYISKQQQADAEKLAQQLGLHCQPASQNLDELVLNFTSSFLEIRDLQQNIAIHIDFVSGSLAHRREYGGGRNQPLARAVGIKPGFTPSVLDATAGLAKDAFVLATLRCPVIMIERSPFVAALIHDAMQRAAQDETFAPLLQNGFQLVNANAIDYLSTPNEQKKPDVIYLDPMYPEKQKSALVKKNMQILQKLLGQDEDTEQLLAAARHCAKKRVVVKRPKGAGFIGHIKPAFDVASKNTRYDVYLPLQE
ncbi:MAG: rRNA (guanine1516-N2)-methyltransferase [Pseudomonadota bacterium]|nr:rRNA (guanine1516-N2)-methyltransferase [Pseudomonadota bacterium]